ncbi:MAG TPA: Hpt domain-containing protein [Gammaproteobacteria bacterium]|nr:Hpt domain-containing protein [Gammaproteobacteria bacterium]
MINPELPADLANDPEFLSLVEQFVSRLPGTLGEAGALLKDRRWEALTQLMHNLKGSAGGYGFPELTRQAEKIHGLLRKHETDALPALLEEMKRYCQCISVSAEG